MAHTDVAIIVGGYQQEEYMPAAVYSAENQIVPYDMIARGCELPTHQVIQSVDTLGMGASWHRNKVISKTDADWIIWLDADDLLSSTHLFWMWHRLSSFSAANDADNYKLLVASPVQFFAGCRLDKFECLQLVPEYVQDLHNLHLMSTLWPFAMGAMFSKKAWMEVDGFDTTMAPLEDWDFWMRIRKLSKSYTLIAPNALMLKRDIPKSHLKSLDLAQESAQLKAFNERHGTKLTSVLYPYTVPSTTIL